MEDNSEFILLIDSYSASLTSKMQVLGIQYEGRSLKSKAPNWMSIAAAAESDNCRAVVLTLSERIYNEVARVDKESCHIAEAAVQRVIQAVARKPHIILSHQALIGGAAIYKQDSDSEGDSVEDDSLWGMNAREMFGDIDEEVRIVAGTKFDQLGLEVFSYKRNVEAEQLAVGFIEAQNSNLIFRMYVPNGHLYQQETDQIFDIFHTWLLSIRQISVRKSSYATGKGRVVEFHAGSAKEAQLFNTEVPQFRKFVSQLGDTDAAELMLRDYGIQSHAASSFIADFAKKFRRLERDIRHKGEEARLRLRHQLEEELGEELPAVPAAFILEVVERVVPRGPLSLMEPGSIIPSSNVSITTNISHQQIVQHAEGIVAQEFQGTAILSEGAKEIEALIAAYARTNEIEDLKRALRELDDGAAPGSDRVKARGLLRSFLATVADKAAGTAFSLGQKYLESQLGMS